MRLGRIVDRSRYARKGSLVKHHFNTSDCLAQGSVIVDIALDEIKITAGVGAFVPMSKPEIIIGGMRIPINDYGVATYKIKPVRTGKYAIPVRIEYFDQDRKKQIIERIVKYMVVKDVE